MGAVSLALPAFLRDVTSYQWKQPEQHRLVALDAKATDELEATVAAKRSQLERTFAGDGTALPITMLAGTHFPNRWFLFEAELTEPIVMHIGGLNTGGEVVVAQYIAPARDDATFAHLLRTFTDAAVVSSTHGFRRVHFARFTFELPAELSGPRRFHYEGEGVRVGVDVNEPFAPSRADLAAEMRSEAPNELVVVDEPVLDQSDPPFAIKRRRYRVRAHFAPGEPAHAFQLSHVTRGGRLLASIFAYAAPGAPDVETIVRGAEQTLHEHAPT